MMLLQMFEYSALLLGMLSTWERQLQRVYMELANRTEVKATPTVVS